MNNGKSPREFFLILSFLTVLVFLGFYLHGDFTFQIYVTYVVVSPFIVSALIMTPVWIIVFSKRCLKYRGRSIPDIIGLVLTLFLFGWVLSHLLPMIDYVTIGAISLT